MVVVGECRCRSTRRFAPKVTGDVKHMYMSVYRERERKTERERENVSKGSGSVL